VALQQSWHCSDLAIIMTAGALPMVGILMEWPDGKSSVESRRGLLVSRAGVRRGKSRFCLAGRGTKERAKLYSYCELDFGVGVSGHSGV